MGAPTTVWLTLVALVGHATASSLTDFTHSTVVYTSSTGTQVQINQCTAATVFSNADPTLNNVDAELQQTSAIDYLSTGPSVFRECVRTNPVLALGDNEFTQAVIDHAASNIDAGYPYSDIKVHEVCRHHFMRCFMFYDGDWLGDGSSIVSDASASYNLTITYNGSTYAYPVSIRNCPQTGNYHSWLTGVSANVSRCFLHETHLADDMFSAALQHAEGTMPPHISQNGRYAWSTDLVCNKQQHVCNTIPDYQTTLSDGCKAVLPKCRAALKHMHSLMTHTDPNEQQCNNFALKFMRGFFHDFETADIEGSILWELHMGFNGGLCRWGQYVNALSDATGCDPGSIIAMGGQLSYKACGIDMWGEGGEGQLAGVHIGRGYECKANFNPNIDVTNASGHTKRKEEFEDMSASSNSTAMEHFWWMLNGHYNPQTAQLFYATQVQ
mmetsp:Transcript_63305/g.188530  ORF Transcript_63305/g.188530 Transcript_63305/m.188530 type:complete len:440 (-) Transcript_63305:40-1359(-)